MNERLDKTRKVMEKIARGETSFSMDALKKAAEHVLSILAQRSTSAPEGAQVEPAEAQEDLSGRVRELEAALKAQQAETETTQNRLTYTQRLLEEAGIPSEAALGSAEQKYKDLQADYDELTELFKKTSQSVEPVNPDFNNIIAGLYQELRDVDDTMIELEQEKAIMAKKLVQYESMGPFVNGGTLPPGAKAVVVVLDGCSHITVE